MKALVVGAGGLGGPIALALGAAGIDLDIVDADVVEVSNLHRQIQFTDADVGRGKAATLAARQASGDPRPSLAERYASHADYVAKVTAAAQALEAQRLLVDIDVAKYISTATAAAVP